MTTRLITALSMYGADSVRPSHRLGQLLCFLIPIAMGISHGVADGVASLLAFLFLIHTVIDRDGHSYGYGWVLPAALLWIYGIARSFFAGHSDVALAQSLPIIRYFMLALAIPYYIRTASDNSRLAWIMAGVVGFLALDSIYQYCTGLDVIGREAQLLPVLRLTGPYSSPRVGAMMTFMLFPVIGLALMRERTPRQRYGLLAIAALAIAAVFLSGERMAFLLIGLGLGLGWWMGGFYRWWKTSCLLAILGIGAIALLCWQWPALWHRHALSTWYTVSHLSTTSYGQLWIAALGMVQDFPIFGTGMRHFAIYCMDYMPLNAAEWCNLHTHNIYLEWLTEWGAVGALLWLWWLVILARYMLHYWYLIRLSPLMMGIVIAILIRLWPLASTTSFFKNWGAIPFFFMLGWLMSSLAINVHKRVVGTRER